MNTPHTPPAVSESRPKLKMVRMMDPIDPNVCIRVEIHGGNVPAQFSRKDQQLAKSLVALWNSDPAAEIARLRAQRDELLEALQAVSRLDYLQEHNELARIVQTAIANATRQ